MQQCFGATFTVYAVSFARISWIQLSIFLTHITHVVHVVVVIMRCCAGIRINKHLIIVCLVCKKSFTVSSKKNEIQTSTIAKRVSQY